MTGCTVVVDDKGGFAVEIQSSEGRREAAGGFRSEADARTSMLAHQRNNRSGRDDPGGPRVGPAVGPAGRLG
jgi:hypothetical protein